MTEPRSGRANQPGQPGGSWPPTGRPPADTGRGNTGASSTGASDTGRGDTGAGDTGRGNTGASASGPRQPDTGFDRDTGMRETGRPTQGEGAAQGEGATEGGGVKTRTQPAQATVPQQYGRQAERGAEGEAAGVPAEGGLIAAAAGRAFPGVVLCALGMLALGIMLLVWPAAALTLVAVLIGAAIIVAGLVKLHEAFTASNHSGGMRAGYIAIGLLAILAGSYLLLHHALSLFLLAFVTGVFFMAHGVTDIGAAISGHVPGRTLRAVLGVLSIAAGIVMVVWPAISLVLLLTIVAAWLLCYGLLLGGLAYHLRKASKEGGGAARTRGAPSFRRKLAPSAR
jgi:uncharacterized membrane protein HdeD (DUF308 family)